jgi:hypothetical protein
MGFSHHPQGLPATDVAAGSRKRPCGFICVRNMPGVSAAYSVKLANNMYIATPQTRCPALQRRVEGATKTHKDTDNNLN